jgi:DNA-binding FadR family transcriptional regulator
LVLSDGSLDRVEGLREPQRLSQQLSTLLAAEIVSGRIAAGDVFPSSEEIVNRFAVSRTVARETVQTLAMLGMVNIQHGKRTEVRPAGDWDILSPTIQQAMRREGEAQALLDDLYEFRLLIEPQAAAWMAQHAAPEDLAQLGALVERMEAHSRPQVSVTDVLEADRAFHELVARASHNRVLAAVSRDIREVIETLWDLSHLEPADAARLAEQHRRIADAVLARDATAAAAAMREHLQWAARVDLRSRDGAPPRVLTATAAE